MSYLDPPSNFSSRFHVRNQQRRRTPEDEALEKHIHGSLFPFESQPFNPCFPVQLPSRKVKSYARGTFGTGTVDGWGFISAAPFMVNNPAGNLLQYTVGAALAYDGFSNGTNVSSTNSPYVIADFAAQGLNGRCSAMSLRVRNITPMLSRGGTLYALKSPNDEILSCPTFNDAIGDLDATGNAVRCDTSGGEWQTISWCPRDSDQFEYGANPSALSFNGSLMTRTVAFVAQAPNVTIANQQTYEWEWVCHFDVIAFNNSNLLVHGATRGVSHLQVAKANQIVTDLHLNPKIIKNTASSKVAGFIADMIEAGQGAAEIVGAASDLVDRTAAIAPRVIASARALGAWL